MLALMSQMSALGQGEWVEVPIQLPFNFKPPSSYPRQAREEFGPRVDRLNKDWTTYLSRASVTLGAKREPLMTHGRWNRVVRRFSTAQVGSDEFWRHGNDLIDFLEQTHCLANHFLIDGGYVAPDTYAAPGQCPLDEIRIPQP
jgi:hypothetical protein